VPAVVHGYDHKFMNFLKHLHPPHCNNDIKAHEGAGGSKGAGEEMCVTVIMMNKLQSP
jgi:hypothetical protein